MIRRKLLFFISFTFLILSAGNSFGQIILKNKKDSISFTKDVHGFSKKNKFTRFIYKNLFIQSPVLKKKPIKKIVKDNCEGFNCKIIRSIIIKVYDPFGYELKDTLKRPLSVFQKVGNKTHIQSTRFSIRNFFMFHDGEEFDAYKLSETERLMRLSNLFRDILITPTTIDGCVDSIDLYVKVIDKWSLTVAFTANPNRARFTITESNFLGLGHESSNSFDYNKDIALEAYQGTYSINRIGNTFISAKIIDENRSDKSSQKAIEIIRPFYSPITKWAGGLSVGQSVINDKLYFLDTIKNNLLIKFSTLDFFVSHSVNLKKHGLNIKKFAPNQNFIFSLRSLSNRVYSNGTLGDSLGLYKNRDYVLGMVALSYVGYESDRFLFKFGDKEDIPVGNFYGLIGGYDYRNDSQYFGFRLGSAKLTSRGYISFFAEAGMYEGNKYSNATILNLESTYYTPLFTFGKWNVRQFVKPRLTLGWDQPLNKSLILSDNEGIQGFSNENIYGNKRATLYLQTQGYSPYTILGFRFGPVFYFNCGIVSDNKTQLFQNSLYSAVGFGIVFKNEYLTLNAFDVSISLYSYIPEATSYYKTNAFRTVHFDLRNINVEKPDFAEYK